MTNQSGNFIRKAMNPKLESGKRAKDVVIGLMKENKTYDELLVFVFLHLEY